MRSHFYLLRTGLKNRLKEVLHKPGKLVLYILIILGIAAAIVGTRVGASYSEQVAPVSYLGAGFCGFLIIFYITSIQKGLSSGDSIFDMSDVNLIFVSPVNPRATLLYGVIRLVGVSFWAGFFLLFQGSTLANFGIGFGGVFVLFGVFILNMVVLTILSLVIYSVTNGRPFRKMIVRIIAAAVFAPALLFFAVRFFTGGDILQALNDVIGAHLISAIPVIGWASAGSIALVEGNMTAALLWLGLLVLSGAGMLLYIMLSRSDYYEDVLVATETAFEKKRAAAERNVQMAGATNARVRVKKTGLSGTGARVFLHKHLRETFRKNRLGFFSIYMIIITIGLVAASVFLRGSMDIILALPVLAWLQVFLIGTGRGLLETYSHYIYMIPGSPFKKLIWSNMELMLRTAVEGVLFLGIPGAVLGSNPAVIIGSMAVYILFSLMLLGVNYLSMRFTEANISQGILMMIYFAAVLIIIAPGLAAALIVGFSVGGTTGTLLALLILSVWELIAALGCFALSKGVLHNCDMPNTGARRG